MEALGTQVKVNGNMNNGNRKERNKGQYQSFRWPVLSVTRKLLDSTLVSHALLASCVFNFNQAEIVKFIFLLN